MTNNKAVLKLDSSKFAVSQTAVSDAPVESADKTVKLYEAAISMLEEGSAPHEIKMSDIAKRAGIGKGTIYEYFQSKEQLFHKTRIYAINYLTDQVTDAINQKTDFRGKVKEFIIRLSSKVAENAILIQSVAKHDLPAMLTLVSPDGYDDDKMQIAEKWLKIAEMLVNSALEQGFIKETPCVYKQHIAITTLVFTSLMYCKNSSLYGDMQQEDMIDIVTDNLIKMFG